MKHTMEVRIVDKGDGMFINEKYSGKNTVYSFKFDEEYDFYLADFNVDDKRVTTKTGPGRYLTVCKSNKDGKVYNYTMSFTDCGVVFRLKMGAIEGSVNWKRVADIEGTWKIVTHFGMDAYLECLGVTGNLKMEMIEETEKEIFTIERMSGGKLRNKQLRNTKFFPNEVVCKMDESYTMDLPGMGSIEAVTTELGDTVFSVMKFSGKTITMNQKVTGHFMVNESCVNGNQTCKSKIVYTRC